MDIEAVRKHCLSFPHATENVQWGCDLCFKVGGKLFAVMPLEVAPVRLSFKCSPESFVELCERPGVKPAPYMARAQWVALEQLNALADAELREALAEAYRLIWEKLPKRLKAELEGAAAPGKPAGAAQAKKKAKVTGPLRKDVPARPAKTKAKSAKAGRRG